MNNQIPRGLGWIPDLPDPRDFTFDQEPVRSLLKKLRSPKSLVIPSEADLQYGDEGEPFFPPPWDQGELNSSSAFAVLDLLEYFERRIHGRTFEGSKLFLYKLTRNVRSKSCDSTGDTGADLRTTLKVLRHFGVPREECWRYNVQNIDKEPTAFTYKLSKPLDDLIYFRLDLLDRKASEASERTESLWDRLTAFIAAGFPIAFGFSVSSYLTPPTIAFHPDYDRVRGGQAALAVGYKLNFLGKGKHALKVRLSWGSQWGDNGNGWIPEAFVRNYIAKDFWTIIRTCCVDSTELSQPTFATSSSGKR